jgi:hypothetical protein
MDMWDEEKFFQDFKREAAQIEPEPEFVEKLLSLPTQKEKKVFYLRKGYSFAAVAFAAVLLCIVGVRFLPSAFTDKEQMGETDLYANQGTTEQNSDIISGTIGALNDEAKAELVKLLMAEDSLVLESGERVLTAEEKEILADRIDTAKQLQKKKDLEEGVRYQVKQKDKIILEFEIVDDSYLLLETGEKIYELD